jgi:ABC-2 type transport system permease protein
MSGFGAVYLVARREVVERVRERSYWISSLVTVAIILAVVIVPSLLGLGDDGERTVGLVGTASEPYAEALPVLGDGLDLTIDTVSLDSAGAAATAVEEGDVDAAVVDGRRLLTSASPGDTLVAAVQEVGQQLRVVQSLEEAGIPAEEAVTLLAPSPLEVSDPTGGDDDGGGFGFAFLVVLVLYGQILGFGYLVGSGVVEEKSTRVVELLLATIRPGHLLAGKVIGIGIVGLSQLVLMAAVGLGVATGTGVVELPDGALTAIAQGVLWFLLGFTFYACAYAMLAALVSRQEDLQNVLTPVTMLVLGGFFLSFAALNDPGSTLARIGSFLPPFAPLVVPARGTAVPVGETVLAIGLALAASAVLIVLAGRVYSNAVLRMGAKVKLTQALRASR